MASKVTKKQSLGVVYSLRSILRIGHSVPSAISLLRQVEKGQLKKVLTQIEYLIYKSNVYPEEALARFGIISRTEVFMLKNATNAQNALSDIITMREMSSRFEKNMGGLLGFPALAVLIGLTIAYFAQPTFYNMMDSMARQVKAAKSIEINGAADLMWYLQDQDFDLLLMILYAFSVAFLLLLYKYLIEYRPNVIYRTMTLKAYDDVPFILMMMNNLHNVGLDPNRIFQILETTSTKKGWIPLFRSLGMRSKKGEHLYPVFESFGFPRDIVLILKSSEVSRTFWDSMDSLIEYAKENNEIKNAMFKKMFGGLSTILGYGIIIYFVFGMFMAMFSLQSLATTMM
jgi:type II secretory pathway component PulF